MRPSRGRRFALGVLPLVGLVALAGFLVGIGPRGLFPGEFPPVEDLSFGRVTLEPGRIELVVTNGGRDPVTIAQVLVDDAYWQHTVEPSRRITRLGSATVTIPYPWVEAEPVHIALVSSTGLTFEHTIEVATATPDPGARFLLTFGLLGIYIGVIPVFLGMSALGFLRSLDPRWVRFFMALTAGILAFLGIETLLEAFDQAGALPTALGGGGLVAAASIGTFLAIFAGARAMQRRTGGDARMVVAFTVATAIGLHNLGEGLAVGAAYRLGEIALGAFLVLGFAIHNVTEGIGIVAIVSDRKVRAGALAGLGLIAGAPAILGGWIGAFLFNPTLATVFLAVATGAIAEVVVDVLRTARSEAPSGLGAPEILLGVAGGLATMYATGLLVAA